MRKLLILTLLLTTQGYAFSEESQLKNKHFTRACGLVATSPQYQAEQKYVEEYYKLQDLAGHDEYASSFVLGITFKTINAKTLRTGLPWAAVCEEYLREDFAEDLVN